MTHLPATHEHPEEDLAAYAVDGLAPEQQARVERHLASCEACRAIVLDYRSVLHLMPLGLPLIKPPERLLDALLNAARAEVRQPTSSWTTIGWRQWPALLMSAAALVLMLLGIGGWFAWESRDTKSSAAEIVANIQPQPRTLIMSMTGSDNAPNAVGQLIISSGEQQTGLIVSGMPQPADGRVYQFWFVRPDDSRVSGGVFTVDARGAAVIVVDAPEAFSTGWSCGVSEEPAGGYPTSAGRHMLCASYDETW